MSHASDALRAVEAEAYPPMADSDWCRYTGLSPREYAEAFWGFHSPRALEPLPMSNERWMAYIDEPARKDGA